MNDDNKNNDLPVFVNTSFDSQHSPFTTACAGNVVSAAVRCGLQSTMRTFK
jgi:hypothetical protein